MAALIALWNLKYGDKVILPAFEEQPQELVVFDEWVLGIDMLYFTAPLELREQQDRDGIREVFVDDLPEYLETW